MIKIIRFYNVIIWINELVVWKVVAMKENVMKRKEQRENNKYVSLVSVISVQFVIDSHTFSNENTAKRLRQLGARVPLYLQRYVTAFPIATNVYARTSRTRIEYRRPQKYDATILSEPIGSRKQFHLLHHCFIIEPRASIYQIYFHSGYG